MKPSHKERNRVVESVVSQTVSPLDGDLVTSPVQSRPRNKIKFAPLVRFCYELTRT
jgi:hypothetical protein